MNGKLKKTYQQDGYERSSKELLLQVYDEVLEAAAVMEYRLARSKVELLINGLSFEKEPITAVGLARLYDYLLDCCSSKDSPEIVRIVAQLKATVAHQN